MEIFYGIIGTILAVSALYFAGECRDLKRSKVIQAQQHASEIGQLQTTVRGHKMLYDEIINQRHQAIEDIRILVKPDYAEVTLYKQVYDKWLAYFGYTEKVEYPDEPSASSGNFQQPSYLDSAAARKIIFAALSQVTPYLPATFEEVFNECKSLDGTMNACYMANQLGRSPLDVILRCTTVRFERLN